MQNEITGELRNHEFQQLGDIQIVKGNIYGDTKGRFEDGTRIRSSVVERVEGDLVYTMNSTYRIIN